MHIISDTKLNYDDVLIVPKRSSLDSRSDVNITREFKGRWATSRPCFCPIIASNMWNTGTKEMALALNKYKCTAALHKFYSVSELDKILLDRKNIQSRMCFFTIGQSAKDLDLVKQMKGLANWLHLFINIDVANGYRDSFIDFVKEVRYICITDWIMAGNVTTPELTGDLIKAGADVVKVGIGPGSVCQTRKVSGIGYPMLSAIIECSDAARGLDGHICADGGCKTPGDVCKAFCAGADFVMLGGMFAGTNECQGEWKQKYYQNHGVEKEISQNEYLSKAPSHNYYTKKSQLKFFGMSSHEAMKKFGGSEKNYRASEGLSTWIDYKGEVADVIEEIQGGLRSCGTYIGADSIKKFPKCATFCKVN